MSKSVSTRREGRTASSKTEFHKAEQDDTGGTIKNSRRGAPLWCSRLRIKCCHCSSWVAVVAWVWFLAQELPHAMGVAKKKKKKFPRRKCTLMGDKSHLSVITLGQDDNVKCNINYHGLLSLKPPVAGIHCPQDKHIWAEMQIVTKGRLSWLLSFKNQGLEFPLRCSGLRIQLQWFRLLRRCRFNPQSCTVG